MRVSELSPHKDVLGNKQNKTKLNEEEEATLSYLPRENLPWALTPSLPWFHLKTSNLKPVTVSVLFFAQWCQRIFTETQYWEWML